MLKNIYITNKNSNICKKIIKLYYLKFLKTDNIIHFYF